MGARRWNEAGIAWPRAVGFVASAGTGWRTPGGYTLAPASLTGW